MSRPRRRREAPCWSALKTIKKGVKSEQASQGSPHSSPVVGMGPFTDCSALS
jgi:hypothetical protein